MATKKTTAHAHINSWTSGGNVLIGGTTWEVCDCGATRSAVKGQRIEEVPWHACAFCSTVEK